MADTYQAVEITSPGVFNLVSRPLRNPSAGQVRIRVEACGVCHSDAATVEGTFPGLQFPRVPGHEVVGRIDRIGSDVTDWKVGQRVSVGFFGGEDRTCKVCRRGDIVHCLHPTIPGITIDGGYAEMMIAEARALAAVPEQLNSHDAAPLACAGVTTFNALRRAGLKAGDLVAVQGVGGLGHLGIQFARRMGFHTVAIGRGAEKEQLAKNLGAHAYIDTAKEDGAAALQKMGGASAILATAPSGSAMGSIMGGLAVRGKLIVVGGGSEPIPVNPVHLFLAGQSIHGSLTGTALDNQDTFDFSVLQNIRPMIETVPLAQAEQAYARMMEGKARFRMVLTIN
jgi:alcohol dehydrogenase, propanol-preferring